MKRRALAGAVLLVAWAAAAQLPQAWRNWQYSAALELDAADAPRLVSVPVPAQVNAQAQAGWGDLRVIDSSGREVPYILHTRFENQTREVRPSRLLEVSFLPGQNTQGIVDTGTEGLIHNSLEIQTTELDYFVYVEIDVSGDSRNWRILRDRTPIYRFTRDGLDGNQTIRYSPSNSRYLRVRILEGKHKFEFTGCRVAQEVTTEAEREPLEAFFRPDPATPAQKSWWIADLGSTQPASEVRFSVEQPEFHRAVRVSNSADGKVWGAAGYGDIYRVSGGKSSAGRGMEEQTRERLKVSFGEGRARYWRVEVFNHNDAPLPGVRVDLWGTPRHVVFRQEPGQSYRLIYGNTRASAPEYELRRLVDAKTAEAAAAGKLGAQETNSAYADPAPWTERNKYVLWVAVVAAVVVLGALALRALRTPS